MARKVITVKTDDLDGSEAAHTFDFSFQGTSYRIDLNDQNAERFNAALAPFISRATTLRKPGPTKSSKARTAAIRSWAAENGIHLKSRGMIPREVMEKFEAARGAAG